MVHSVTSATFSVFPLSLFSPVYKYFFSVSNKLEASSIRSVDTLPDLSCTCIFSYGTGYLKGSTYCLPPVFPTSNKPLTIPCHSWVVYVHFTETLMCTTKLWVTSQKWTLYVEAGFFKPPLCGFWRGCGCQNPIQLDVCFLPRP